MGVGKGLCDNCGNFTRITVVQGRPLCGTCYQGHYPPCSLCGQDKPADLMSGGYLGNDNLHICDNCGEYYNVDWQRQRGSGGDKGRAAQDVIRHSD